MEEIIKQIGKQYYTDPILISVLLISIFVSLKNRKKFKILTYFPVYIVSLLIAYCIK